MPPKLPRISGAETVRILEKLGFRQARQRGSHVVMSRQSEVGKVGCVVPLHRELAIGTLRAILRQANVSVEEFLSKL